MTTGTPEVSINAKPGNIVHAGFVPPVFEAIALFVVCAFVLGLLMFATPGLIENDGYYHARAADQILVQRRLALEFPWLPKTILSPEQFVDHHLLYHLYVAPWVHWGGLIGAKLAQVIVASGVFVAVWALLRQIGARYPALWTLSMLGLSIPFLYRLLMVRTQGAALLLLVLALLVMIQQRHRWLILLSFAFAWLYNGFILMPVFASMYVAANWLTARRIDLRPGIYASLGIVLGLIFNPYFPRNIMFIAEHLGAKVDFESGVAVGIEWYPYPLEILVASSLGAILLLVFGLAGYIYRKHWRDQISTLLLFASLLTLVMLLRSRRFIEYYPTFALLFCAAVWARPIGKRLWRYRPQAARFMLVASAIFGAILVAVTFAGAQQFIAAEPDAETFAGASTWLKENTATGTLVFQTDYDDFTRLFYYNTSNTYLTGLDTTYLQRADPVLWDTWHRISSGEIAQPSKVIRNRFGALHVVSDLEHTAFIAQAAADPDMIVVYSDVSSIVWRIIK